MNQTLSPECVPSGSLPSLLVLGGGSWGTALAVHLASAGHPVVQWVRDPILAKDIRQTRENRVYLPGASYPSSIRVENDLEKALEGANTLVLAVPCQAVRDVLVSVRALLSVPPLPLVGGTKGIERKTHMLVSAIVREVYSDRPDSYAVLSGPSFAREVVRKLPTAVVLASGSVRLASEAQTLFSGPSFKVYTRQDVVGLEVAGAMKNVMALAAGISDGMQLGANSRAALLTRGLAEMTRLGVRLGAHPQTFSGLGGVGDLMLTATSELSRNRRVGMLMGQGKSLPEVLREVGQVAEGVPTTQSAYELAREIGVDLPITTAIYQILYEGAGLEETLESLMARPSRSEEEETLPGG
ncbi:MAG: NAD(P)-dependent glycerol-3-phosphate dehydrogenase [Nitrospirae bacterium]|nr:NAD(P)-dependent glycerol-3-phosphate dehydrogenase [Nitrospirota bacterium]